MTMDLYEAIQRDADKFGRTWNETAEIVLQRVFLGSG